MNDDVSNIIIAQLLFPKQTIPSANIYLYVNSPGGSVSSGLAIYDTMQYLKSPVNTIAWALRRAWVRLLSAGRKGKRFALPHSRIMIHQPSQSGGGGSASEIEIQAREILYLRSKLTSSWPSTPASRSTGSRRTPIGTGSCRPTKRKTTESSIR